MPASALVDATTRRRARALTPAALVVLARLLAACGGGERATTPPAPAVPVARVAAVELSAADDTLATGARTTLTAVARDAAGAPLAARHAAWTSADTDIVAVVAEYGTSASVVARAPGVTRVTAVVDGRSASVRILVWPRVAGVRLAPDSVTLHVGDGRRFAATAVDSVGARIDGRVATWRSADTTIAAVAADGRVSARRPGRVRVVATVDGVTDTSLVTVRAAVPEPEGALALELTTYEGSGEVVHPDVAFVPQRLGGYRYWMAVTPYPNANPAYEDPSIFASQDGEEWEVPAGATNPIARTVRGHLSDPALVHDAAAGRLRVFYREAVYPQGVHQMDVVWQTTSADGVRWTPPVVAWADTGRFVVSPTVVRGGGGGAAAWRAWSVDAGADGCTAASSRVTLRTSADAATWSPPTPVRFAPPGWVPWHLDVQWVSSRREYWALYAAYPVGGSCARTDLFLATSPDGLSWTTHRAPLLARGVAKALSTLVYRSTFVHDSAADMVTLWLSGAREAEQPRGGTPALVWSAAIARTSVAALFTRLTAPAPMAAHGPETSAALQGMARENRLP